jgi:hypothetical protein
MIIPKINRVFLEYNIDVFRIEVDQAALKEIFVNMK